MTQLSTDDLLDAVYRADRKAIDAHLAAGGDLNAVNAQGFSPLVVAMEGRHPELAVELIDQGADVRHVMPGGFTTLHVLIKLIRNRPVNMSVTVQRGGKKVKLTDPDEIRKVLGGHPDDEYRAWLALARKLVDGGVDVNAAKEASGQRPLRDASEASSDLVALLLERARPDVNAADNEGFTPLHLAARSGDTRSVELLLEAGANVDAAESYGFTPLHEALLNKHREVARQLLDAGADPTKRLVRSYDALKAGDDAHAIAGSCGMSDVFGGAPAEPPSRPRASRSKSPSSPKKPSPAKKKGS